MESYHSDAGEQAPRLSPDGEFGGEAPRKHFRVAPLRGRQIVLRQIMPEDYRFLRVAELRGELALRWRFRGATPSPDRWTHTFWDGVLAQFLVTTVRKGQPIGIVTAYRPNFHDGHAYVGVAALEQSPARAIPGSCGR